MGSQFYGHVMAASSKRKVHNGNENVGSNPTLPTNFDYAGLVVYLD